MIRRASHAVAAACLVLGILAGPALGHASLVESVQQGLDSGMVQQGRLLLSCEHLIQHFQRLVFEALTDTSD